MCGETEVDTLSDRESRYLAGLKRKPMDFETYPPVYQTQCFVEYLIARGTISFSAKDIQDLFRHAKLQKALADKPNIPRPSTIRTYINNAVKAGRLSLHYEESTDRWFVRYPAYSILFSADVKANDAIQAKDIVKTKVALGNQIVSESVTTGKPWIVTIEISTRYSSKAAVWGEIMELMSATARRWSLALADGSMEVESTGHPKVGKFNGVKIKLLQSWPA